MDVEAMREAVRLSDRIVKLEAFRKRLSRFPTVRITPFLSDGKGSSEDVMVPAKSVDTFYRKEIRRLREQVAELQK